MKKNRVYQLSTEGIFSPNHSLAHQISGVLKNFISSLSVICMLFVGIQNAAGNVDPHVTIPLQMLAPPPIIDTSKMEWVFLPPGSIVSGCVSHSNCCQDTLCYGLKYTPSISGNLTSYTTGFFTNCLSGMSPVDSNSSCVMQDNSFQINGCNPFNLVLFNSSGNSGDIPVTVNVPLILHKVCFYVPAGDTLTITEDTVTDLTTSIRVSPTEFVTEHPDFDTFKIFKTAPVMPPNGSGIVQCADDAIPPVTPVVLDMCGDTIVPTLLSINYQPNPLNCEGSVTYVYSYQDCSNLVTTWTFVYTIDHTTPPSEIGGPVATSATVTCFFMAVPPALPEIKDVCGEILAPTGPPSITGTSTGCAGTRIYTYTYADCSGLPFSWSFTYTILPNNSLAINCPADLVLTCTAGSNYVALINAWLATATATDGCDANVVITNNYDGMSIPSFACMGGLNVTFTATDNCGNTATCVGVISKPCFNLETWVYLEGAATNASGGASYTLPMRTTLNDLHLLPGQLAIDPFTGNHYTPAGQPYSGAPWLYPGTEGSLYDSGGNPMFASAGYPTTVVDWVLVSLRLDSAGTGGPVCQAAALLQKDGVVQFVQPLSCCGVNENTSYYVTIEHRNHLIVMSHMKVPFVNHILSYDFRFQNSYEDPLFAGFNLFAREKQILPGKFAMYAGNGQQTGSVNADTDINFDDRTFWESQNGFFGSYRVGDYNLNGDTNFNDRIVWERNNGKFTSVPRN